MKSPSLSGTKSPAYYEHSKITDVIFYSIGPRVQTQLMEQLDLKNVNTCLKTSGGQSSNLYLNVVHFFQRQC
jgi:hypothetical protein